MGTTKKHIGMNISRQNTNDSIDTPIKLNNNNNNNNTSSCSSINNMINQQKNQQRNNVYVPTPPTSKNIIINSNNNHNYNDNTIISNNTNSNNNNNTNNRKNDSLIKNNSAYLTTRRCLNKKSQLNINSSSKNNLNESKNINSYINKLSLAKQIQQDQKHQQQEQQQQQQKNSFNQQHSNSFGFEKSKLENRNHNLKNPIVSVLNNSSNSNSISSNINRKVSSKASVENYLKPFYLNEYSKCEKENSFNLKTKKSSIKELKISNITNIQASIERYETNQLHHHHHQQQQQQHHHRHHHHHPHLDTCSQLDTPVIYLNSSLNTNFSLNHHNCFNNNNNNNNSTITTTKITNYDKSNEENHEQQKQFGFLNHNSNLIQKIDRPASILSLNKSPSSNHTNLNPNQNINNNENDSVVSFSQLTFNETNNDESDLNMLSSQSNIVNASATSFRLTQSQKEKQQCKAFTLKSNKSIASSSSSSQNLIASLNQSQISKLIAATATITPNSHTHSNKGESVGNTNTTSKKPSTKLTSLTCTRPSKTSNHQEYEGGLVEKMASFIDELKDFIDDRLIDTTSQLELANQRISGLYFNLNYLTSELINLKKQNEELKKELIFKNNTTRSLIQEQQYLDTYSEYSKKVHNKNSERYIDSSCMKIPDSNSNLESTMNNSSSKTTSPETTSASSTSTSTSLIISQTPHDNLYKKSTSPPQIYQAAPKSSKDFKTGKHFEHLNDLELKRRETCTNTSKIQSSSSSINSINFYDNMSIVNRFEINWPTRSATDNPNNYSHRTSSPSQIDLQNLIQTQYASTDFDNDELYESNEKNYELIIASQSQQTNSYLPSNNEAIHYETGSPTTKHHTNNDLISNDKELSNEIVHSPTKSNLHHLHASIAPYNNLIADFDTQYIWDYENNSLVHNNKFNDKSIDGNMKFQN